MDPPHCPLQEGRCTTTQEEGKEGSRRRRTLDSFHSRQTCSIMSPFSGRPEQNMVGLLTGYLAQVRI